ncbi:MAG TPA: hypothetical protein VJS63_10565 [Bradyrhizobium sp.]|nr:hypothetical protein [Bradyrhizobium sp.]
MTSPFWTCKGLVLSVAVITLAAVAVTVSIALAYPEPVSGAALGPDWQCTRLAFVFTTCSRIIRTQSAVAGAVGDPACPHRLDLAQAGR